MNNLFDSANFPNIEPEELTVGKFWAWKRPDITEVYPTDTYTLKYSFYLQSSVETRFEFTASKVSSAHVVNVLQAETTKYKHGEYRYQVIVVRDSDSAEVVIEEGQIKLLADLNTGSGDIRSHSRKVLDAIQATIENTATKEQASYTIAGRSLSRRPIEELLTLRREYESLVKKEEQEALRKQGRAKKNSVLIKMRA